MSAAAGAATGGSMTRRFDERFLRKLETLEVAIRRAAGAQARGIRRSRRIGAGLELADHRDYAPGDDLRYLDWNLYGRLGRRALRLFEEDEDVAIDVLVDASASMGLGRPPKLDLAAQLAAALAYVGLANLDRVAVTALGDEPGGLPPQRGKGRILPILRFLEPLAGTGRQSVSAGVRAFLGRRSRRRAGVAVLISDFYDPAGAPAALDLLRAQRLEPIAIQIAAPDELAPSLRGDLLVRDVETGEAHELTISPAAVAAYQRRLAGLRRQLEGHCRERGIRSFCVTSDQALDAVVLRMFRAGGLLA